jgi:hypothetical protein
LKVDKLDIARAVWQEGIVMPRRELGLRIGGAGLPGLLYAGRFAGNEGLNFVYLQRPQREHDGVKLANVLTLELRNSRYHRMVFTTNPDIAEQIITWWSATT